MTIISARLQAVRSRIQASATAASRAPEEIRLLAVSKTFPVEAIREAFLGGQQAFGENYLQEAMSKIEALRDLQLEWHFIGPIQSNKTRDIARNFAWVHSVDRLKLAQRLSEARPESLEPLQICIQVNVSGETSKRGCNPAELDDLARAICRCPRLRLRGLMAIPEATDDSALQHDRFARLRKLKDGLVAKGIDLDVLSMGMSHDLEAAIAEGSTIVRVGRAIFGER